MNIEEFKAKKAELEQYLAEKGEEMLQDMFKEILGSGLIHEVAWHQYTDYWNDGETCYFSVHETWYLPVSFFQDMDEDDADMYGDKYEPGEDYSEAYMYEYITDDHGEEGAAVSRFEKKFSLVEDLLEGIFGDHAHITARLKDGEVEFDVQDYSDHN